MSGISVLPENYTHHTVNHTHNYVDLVTNAYTNNVECMWKNCKFKFKAMHGIQSTTLSSHLNEFMWCQLHKQDVLKLVA